MAINYLNTVDLNKNQLQQAAIHNLASDPTTGVLGQVYYNTTDSILKICTTASISGGANAVWSSVSGDLTAIIAGAGLTGTNLSGPIPTLNAGAGTGITVNADDIAVTPAQTGITSIYNTDLVIGGASSVNAISFEASKIAFTSSNTQVANMDSTKFYPVATNTIALGSATRKWSSVYATTFLGDLNGTINTATTGVTQSAGDNSTKIATTAYADTAAAATNETYTLPVSVGAANSAKIDLTAGGSGSGIKSTVEFKGTTGRINITETVGNNGNITIDMPDDVTIVDDLTVGGVITQSQSGETNSLASKLNMNSNKITNLATGTASTDAVNLGQVELLVAGVGVFKGGYNATSDPGSPAISGSSNIALDQGDYFIVTHDGDITFSDTTVSVEVGDFIFANAAITASSTPASTQYTFVLADANIAGAGSTDGATEKGVAGFDSASFSVSASGWVQLKPQANPYGAKQALNNTSPSARVESGGLTTFTINLADASLFGSGALAENVKVEVTEGSSPFQTVFADVTRSGSASISVIFTGSVANDAYKVLLTYV